MTNDTKNTHIGLSTIEKVGLVLVGLMVILQGFYGVFAMINPESFSAVRGTDLFSNSDADWVVIYGSRTVFIAAVLAYLLRVKHYSALMCCALVGTVMPISDAWLAYEAQAPMKVVIKHGATILYLLVTFFVLKKIVQTNTVAQKEK